MTSPFDAYSAEEILTAAANLRRSRRAARAAARRRENAEARLPAIHAAERRARDLAELGAQLTHVIDTVPLEITVDPYDPEGIRINNLVDRTRWATYLPRGGGYRLFPHRWGDCGSTPYVDLPDADAAERAAIDWALGRG